MTDEAEAIGPTAVNNGAQALLDHPSSAGFGGLVTSNGRTTFAYPTTEAAPPPIGGKITLDGRQWIVTTSGRVEVAKGVRLAQLGLTAADSPPPPAPAGT